MKKVLAILMATLLALAGAGALAEDGALTVQGVGVVHVDADVATICLGARVTAPDVISAQASVNEKLDAVIAALNDMGIGREVMSTDSIGIYPNYDYSDVEERIMSYTAYNAIVFAVPDAENAGAYIDAAFEAGANNLNYVEFSASDTTEAGRKALALAVESARAKAEVLAEAAGVELGPVPSITEAEDGYYAGNAAFARSEDAGKGASTQVLTSAQQVSATVSVTFEISGKK